MVPNVVLSHSCLGGQWGSSPYPWKMMSWPSRSLTTQGRPPRQKITSLGGPSSTTVAAVIVKVKGTDIECSRWEVWGQAGVPHLDAGKVSHFTEKGKAKLKLGFPDLSRFQLNMGPQYKINCSQWMNGI